MIIGHTHYGETLSVAFLLREFTFRRISLKRTLFIMENSPKITAYLKTYCGWSEGVRAVFRKYNLEFEEKDIIKNQAFRWEMEQKSGQPLSPCVEINGTMIPDISGEEVERWMIDNRVIQSSDAEADAPLNSACSDEQHAAMASKQVGNIKFIA